MLYLILVLSMALMRAYGQITCSILTAISPFILVYTPVDFNGAISVCSNLGASLATYTSTMNTEWGLWTEICNFVYNSQVQTATSGFTPPFWVSSTSISGGTTFCGILPYAVGQATLAVPSPSFVNCFLSFYPLCSGALFTSSVTGATTVSTRTTFISTVIATTSTTTVVTSETTQFFFSSVTVSQTFSSVQTSITVTQTTQSITGLTTLTGSTTTTRTRTLQSTVTDNEVAETTISSTSTLTSTTSTSTTTTTTTLKTIFTCLANE
jgi:hypothetical protein